MEYYFNLLLVVDGQYSGLFVCSPWKAWEPFGFNIIQPEVGIQSVFNAKPTPIWAGFYERLQRAVLYG